VRRDPSRDVSCGWGFLLLRWGLPRRRFPGHCSEPMSGFPRGDPHRYYRDVIYMNGSVHLHSNLIHIRRHSIIRKGASVEERSCTK
jgi:hypothetical protein